MERIGVAARALLAFCVAVCVTSGASAAAAGGGQSIGEAPSLKVGATLRAKLFNSSFLSGASVAFWTASFEKGDRISVRTESPRGQTPPCQILYMPGVDDNNVGPTTPILDPAKHTRNGSTDFQRWVTATETGTYV